MAKSLKSDKIYLFYLFNKIYLFYLFNKIYLFYLFNKIYLFYLFNKIYLFYLFNKIYLFVLFIIMGVKNFMKFIRKYASNAVGYTKISDYKNKILGIDANLLLYKIIYAIRVHGYDITNGHIIVTHIHALLLKLIAFKRYNINPVFVFDSFAPEIKFDTLEMRKKTKQKLIDKYKNSKTDRGKRIYYYIKSDITEQEINDCRELIQIFGYQIVDAKEEADAQLAQLYKHKLIDSIVTDDMDILLFGGGILLKNFSVAENKKIQEISLNKILIETNMNLDELIQVGILLGTDYCNNKQYSPTKAYELIKTYSTLKSTIIGHNCDHAFNYFKNPPVNQIEHIKSGDNLKSNELMNFLKKFNFKEKYINKIFENIDQI